MPVSSTKKLSLPATKRLCDMFMRIRYQQMGRNEKGIEIEEIERERKWKWKWKWKKVDGIIEDINTVTCQHSLATLYVQCVLPPSSLQTFRVSCPLTASLSASLTSLLKVWILLFEKKEEDEEAASGICEFSPTSI